jgi:hypothetical protein
MGRQKGIVVLSGTIDGINFYVSKGKALIRKAGGGFTSEGFKSNPRMERTRNNSSEFGKASQAKKMFRMGLDSFLSTYHDGTLHGRLMRLFHKIKVLDLDSEEGQRQVGIGMATPMGQLLLCQFCISERQVAGTLLANCHFDSLSATYEVSGFDAGRVVFPESAVVMELLFGVLVLDFEAMAFELFLAPPLFVDSGFLDTSFRLSPAEAPTGTGIRVAVAGVRFHQVVGGVRYPLKALELQGISIVGVTG